MGETTGTDRTRPYPRPVLGRVRRAVVVAVALVGAACSGSGPGSLARDADDTGAASLLDGAATDTGAGVNPDGTDPLPALADDVALPIVFVHGLAGSAQQYESQAQRFVANGYPAARIVAYDHDGAGSDIAGYADGVAAMIDAARAEFDVEQVYLVGHSHRGTMVAAAYLDHPANAAKVAKYVAIDGDPCPEVVPCLAPTRAALPGQAHVEVATSAESFAMQYEFLVGEPPEVVELMPQRAPVEIRGRAVTFPANTGREARLDIWLLDPATGHRIEDAPLASVELDRNGGFGPVRLSPGAHYEYALSDGAGGVEHHVYLQPYVRSSNLVRLLSAEPDGSTRAATNAGPGHTALIAVRMREWFAVDDPEIEGDQRDVLTVGLVGGAAPVDVLTPAVGNAAIGIHVRDDAATPGRTTLVPLPTSAEQRFQAGVDVHLPSSPEGAGTISVTNLPRGDDARPQVLNVPNWPSDRHAVTVVFTDHPVD